MSITTCPHGTQASAALDLRCGYCERNAPENAQEGSTGVVGPQGLSDSTVPAADAVAITRGHRPTTSRRMPVTCMECGLAWQGDAITGGCTAVLLARANLLLAEDRDWFKAEMERFMHAASANRAEVERLNVVMTDWQDDRDALDRANARTGRFIAILKDVEARATLLERLLREALEGLDALTDDPRDPAIRTLLRQMRAAVGGGSR